MLPTQVLDAKLALQKRISYKKLMRLHPTTCTFDQLVDAIRIAENRCTPDLAPVLSAVERPRNDKRWQYHVPPAGNANFAWMRHTVHHLAPAGVDGFVLANGSISSNQSGEGEIRNQVR